jgi:hypothetical protein
MATILHFVWGVSLVLIPNKVALTTGLAPFRKYPEAFGLLMLASAVCATLTLLHELTNHQVNRLTFWALIPQQVLLFISAYSVVFYVIEGHYASGTVLPRWFIFMDQLPKILLAVLHPFGALRMHIPIFPPRVIAGE